jgi:hypothetical protein
MTTEGQLAQLELSSSKSISSLFPLPKRNLGCAILVAAIEDYQSTDDQTHSSASLFLFPTSPEYRAHFEWVVSMADGVDRAWLRESLDRARKLWDRSRVDQKLRRKFEMELRERRSA